MTLLEMICEELGVKVGEEWEGSDGHRYIINESGKVFHDKEGMFLATIIPHEWVKIISGELKPMWKPTEGDYVWIIDFYEDNNVDKYIWTDGSTTDDLYTKGLVFKTKEEAIEASRKMLDTLKEDK